MGAIKIFIDVKYVNSSLINSKKINSGPSRGWGRRLATLGTATFGAPSSTKNIKYSRM